MSGGVDSSVSAWLLQQQGYQVEGLFMKNWEEDDGEEYCTAAADLADAQAVCDKLGIQLHTVNFCCRVLGQRLPNCSLPNIKPVARRIRISSATKRSNLKPSSNLPPKI
ncbi:hypothetical protein ACLB1R_12325 [Escherichia coli]